MALVNLDLSLSCLCPYIPGQLRPPNRRKTIMPESATVQTDAFDTYLAPTEFIDSDNPAVRDFALAAIEGATTDIEKAVRLYFAVRDGILYDPYSVDVVADHYKASYVLQAGRAYCVPKAILLTATARAVGIPARPGYADVRNHLSTKRLLELTGTDLFIYHGYVELWLDGAWVKCTPVFNLSLCQRFGVKPLDFDGRHDSLLQPYDEGGNRHMEYTLDRGAFADVPFADIAAAFTADYPRLLAFNAQRQEANFAREAEAEHRAGPAE
jgi:transglutaminase-like putative cysteine protease